MTFLALHFLTGAAACLLAFRPAAGPPLQVFLVGSSTVLDKPLDKAERGWGMYFQQYLDARVVVRNVAVNGRSTRSFRTEGRWAKVLAEPHPGDGVLIHFGHNDSKVEDTARYAAPQTAYRQNLTRFAQEACQWGALPVLLTPVGRRYFDEQGRRKDGHGEYPGVVKEVAKQQKVPLIDLHETSWALYSELGDKGTQLLFWSYQNGAHNAKLDNTHFPAYGAERVAQLVAQDVKKLNLPLAKNLRATGFDGKFVFDPDRSSYRHEITYNDNAMIRALMVLRAVAGQQGPCAAVAPAKHATARGLGCILKTQYRRRGQLPARCAQYDENNLLSAKARAFELASLSGDESVTIVRFLMGVEAPSPAVRTAIESTVAWFGKLKIKDMAVQDVPAPNEPRGHDRVMVPAPGAVLWARFYELDTDRPIYVGRDSQVHYQLREIENERRAGYPYAGTWPEKLLAQDYPKWQQKQAKPAGQWPLPYPYLR